MSIPSYEVYAIHYATRDGLRRDHFLGGDPHDGPMPMDYYVWAIRNSERVVVVDTGFDASVATKRQRTLLRSPKDGLAALGIDARSISDCIITHMHNDHAGTLADFPAASFHLQDDEMAFVTGRYMRHERFRRSFERSHVLDMVGLVFDDRVHFHDGDDEIAPGITVHRIGGHTPGMQVVRVHTRRGWLVLASDASHYYEHFRNDRCFPAVFHVGDVLEGYQRLRRLAETPDHVIPGHDPAVMAIYAAPDSALAGVVARVDADPIA